MYFPPFLQSLLSDPNPASPANSEAAKLYAENRGDYEKRVKACVEASWLAEPPSVAAAAAAAEAAEADTPMDSSSSSSGRSAVAEGGAEGGASQSSSAVR